MARAASTEDLLHACCTGDAAAAVLALRSGAAVDGLHILRDGEISLCNAAESPLHLCCHHRQTAVLSILIEAGAVLNIREATRGWTCLMTAALGIPWLQRNEEAGGEDQEEQVIARLVRAGCDVLAPDWSNNTVIHHLALRGSLSLLQHLDSLLTSDSSPDRISCATEHSVTMPFCTVPSLTEDTSEDGTAGVAPSPYLPPVGGQKARHTDPFTFTGWGLRPPLHCAVEGGQLRVSRWLLARCGLRALQAVDAGGWTALHWACMRGDWEMAKMLIAAGASPTAKDFRSLTPLDVAGMYGHADLCRLLEDEAQLENLGLHSLPGLNTGYPEPIREATDFGSSCVKSTVWKEGILRHSNEAPGQGTLFEVVPWVEPTKDRKSRKPRRGDRTSSAACTSAQSRSERFTVKTWGPSQFESFCQVEEEDLGDVFDAITESQPSQSRDQTKTREVFWLAATRGGQILLTLGTVALSIFDYLGRSSMMNARLGAPLSVETRGAARHLSVKQRVVDSLTSISTISLMAPAACFVLLLSPHLRRLLRLVFVWTLRQVCFFSHDFSGYPPTEGSSLLLEAQSQSGTCTPAARKAEAKRVTRMPSGCTRREYVQSPLGQVALWDGGQAASQPTTFWQTGASSLRDRPESLSRMGSQLTLYSQRVLHQSRRKFQVLRVFEKLRQAAARVAWTRAAYHGTLLGNHRRAELHRKILQLLFTGTVWLLFFFCGLPVMILQVAAAACVSAFVLALWIMLTFFGVFVTKLALMAACATRLYMHITTFGTLLGLRSLASPESIGSSEQTRVATQLPRRLLRLAKDGPRMSDRCGEGNGRGNGANQRRLLRSTDTTPEAPHYPDNFDCGEIANARRMDVVRNRTAQHGHCKGPKRFSEEAGGPSATGQPVSFRTGYGSGIGYASGLPPATSKDSRIEKEFAGARPVSSTNLREHAGRQSRSASEKQAHLGASSSLARKTVPPHQSDTLVKPYKNAMAAHPRTCTQSCQRNSELASDDSDRAGPVLARAHTSASTSLWRKQNCPHLLSGATPSSDPENRRGCVSFGRGLFPGSPFHIPTSQVEAFRSGSGAIVKSERRAAVENTEARLRVVSPSDNDLSSSATSAAKGQVCDGEVTVTAGLGGACRCRRTSELSPRELRPSAAVVKTDRKVASTLEEVHCGVKKAAARQPVPSYLNPAGGCVSIFLHPLPSLMRPNPGGSSVGTATKPVSARKKEDVMTANYRRSTAAEHTERGQQGARARARTARRSTQRTSFSSGSPEKVQSPKRRAFSSTASAKTGWATTRAGYWATSYRAAVIAAAIVGGDACAALAARSVRPHGLPEVSYGGLGKRFSVLDGGSQCLSERNTKDFVQPRAETETHGLGNQSVDRRGVQMSPCACNRARSVVRQSSNNRSSEAKQKLASRSLVAMTGDPSGIPFEAAAAVLQALVELRERGIHRWYASQRVGQDGLFSGQKAHMKHRINLDGNIGPQSVSNRFRCQDLRTTQDVESTPITSEGSQRLSPRREQEGKGQQQRGVDTVALKQFPSVLTSGSAGKIAERTIGDDTREISDGTSTQVSEGSTERGTPDETFPSCDLSKEKPAVEKTRPVKPDVPHFRLWQVHFEALLLYQSLQHEEIEKGRAAGSFLREAAPAQGIPSCSRTLLGPTVPLSMPSLAAPRWCAAPNDLPGAAHASKAVSLQSSLRLAPSHNHCRDTVRGRDRALRPLPADLKQLLSSDFTAWVTDAAAVPFAAGEGADDRSARDTGQSMDTSAQPPMVCTFFLHEQTVEERELLLAFQQRCQASGPAPVQEPHCCQPSRQATTEHQQAREAFESQGGVSFSVEADDNAVVSNSGPEPSPASGAGLPGPTLGPWTPPFSQSSLRPLPPQKFPRSSRTVPASSQRPHDRWHSPMQTVATNAAEQPVGPVHQLVPKRPRRSVSRVLSRQLSVRSLNKQELRKMSSQRVTDASLPIVTVCRWSLKTVLLLDIFLGCLLFVIGTSALILHAQHTEWAQEQVFVVDEQQKPATGGVSVSESSQKFLDLLRGVRLCYEPLYATACVPGALWFFRIPDGEAGPADRGLAVPRNPIGREEHGAESQGTRTALYTLAAVSTSFYCSLGALVFYVILLLCRFQQVLHRKGTDYTSQSQAPPCQRNRNSGPECITRWFV
ncbi:putative protein s-acyltransferase 23 [Cystoisospora suis]|uniref:Transmembrane protein n=1 Tax=Cystoisospora suis TaxID=483139 RepID=A0A2C6L0J3_9APIC|nr:putative protein s-acyltransferase 23 [Cystoisospora suis]